MTNLNITVNRSWTTSRVREVCIENDLYTCGDNEEYEHMLSWVRRLYPNTENLHYIAENIYKHSKGQTVTNIMYLLEKDAVVTTLSGPHADFIGIAQVPSSAAATYSPLFVL